MKEYFVKISDPETGSSIMVDMEGPYHERKERIGEQIYGCTLQIDGVPYHFEKYIPTRDEIMRFEFENEGKIHYSIDGCVYRIVPFTK